MDILSETILKPRNTLKKGSRFRPAHEILVLIAHVSVDVSSRIQESSFAMVHLWGKVVIQDNN